MVNPRSCVPLYISARRRGPSREQYATPKWGWVGGTGLRKPRTTRFRDVVRFIAIFNTKPVLMLKVQAGTGTGTGTGTQVLECTGKPLCDDLEELLKGQMHPLIAWSVDVQCDTCQSNIVSAFPKVAWTKSGFHVYCGLDKIRQQNIAGKSALKEKIRRPKNSTVIYTESNSLSITVDFLIAIFFRSALLAANSRQRPPPYSFACGGYRSRHFWGLAGVRFLFYLNLYRNMCMFTFKKNILRNTPCQI